MEKLIDPQNLPVLLFFVLPGYLSCTMWRLFFPGRTTRVSDQLISIVVFGLANYILVGWWLLSISRTIGLVWQIIVIIVVFIFTPLVWPYIVRVLVNIPWVSKRIVHPIPKAWDYFFGRHMECFVLVRLKSGLLLGGVMSSKSFASSYPSDEDLYLEQVWKLAKSGKFLSQLPDSRGALVSRSECEYIQFINLEKENTDGG